MIHAFLSLKHEVPMRTLLLRTIFLASAVIALAAPGAEATLVTLSLDPALSSLTPEAGAPQSLSGTIAIDVGSLPLGGTNTSFDVVGLSLTASGGATFRLDPALANPGLGVLDPAGSFLIPTLFVRVTDGDITEFAIPDLLGSVAFGVGEASIRELSTAFAIETATGLVSLSLVAIPEPATAALLAAGLVALCVRGGRQETCR